MKWDFSSDFDTLWHVPKHTFLFSSWGFLWDLPPEMLYLCNLLLFMGSDINLEEPPMHNNNKKEDSSPHFLQPSPFFLFPFVFFQSDVIIKDQVLPLGPLQRVLLDHRDRNDPAAAAVGKRTSAINLSLARDPSFNQQFVFTGKIRYFHFFHTLFPFSFLDFLRLSTFS